MHYLANAFALPACRCIAKGFNLPCQRTASLLLRGDSHLEIVITIGLFQMDLLLDPQATDLSSNYVRMAVLSHRGSDPLYIHTFCNQATQLTDIHLYQAYLVPPSHTYFLSRLLERGAAKRHRLT